MSIPTDRRQMLLLFCHFNISWRFGICSACLSRKRMSANMRTLRKEHHISYKWQTEMIDSKHCQWNFWKAMEANTMESEMMLAFQTSLSNRNIVHKYWASDMRSIEQPLCWSTSVCCAIDLLNCALLRVM